MCRDAALDWIRAGPRCGDPLAHDMAEFFRTSQVWVVDFRYDGAPRRWFKAFAEGADVATQMRRTLHELHGARAQLVAVRPADADEESQYLRGELPLNAICPTGR